MLDIGDLYGSCKMIGWIFGLFVGTVSASTLPIAFLYQLGSMTYKKLYNTCPTDEISNRIVMLSAYVNGCLMMLLPWRAVQMIALLHNHGLVTVTNFIMAKLIKRKEKYLAACVLAPLSYLFLAITIVTCVPHAPFGFTEIYFVLVLFSTYGVVLAYVFVLIAR